MEGAARLRYPPLRYPVPWDLVAGLAPHMARGTVQSVDEFSAAVVARMHPVPAVCGWPHLPDDPRFVIAANHFQRKGLWILHAASVLTQIVRERYGPGDPPVRWIATANFPRIQFIRWKMRNPGDLLLPHVARVLQCWPVAFHGADPRFTGASLTRLLRAARHLERPIGIFPEGVTGTADRPSPALPGAGRLLRQFAKLGIPVLPVGISEQGRFVIKIGPLIPADALLASENPGNLVMDCVHRLAERRSG